MKKHVISLTALQRAELCLMARSGQGSARQVLRAKILLKADACGEDCTDLEIAKALAVGVATVERVRARFVKEGQSALNRRPQPPRPDQRRLDGKGEAQLVMLACSDPPDGRDPLDPGLLADRLEIHYPPKHGRWQNMAEIELSVVGQRLPDRIEGIHAMDRHCRTLAKERNQNSAGVDWEFTAANARIKLKRLYPSIQLR